LENIWFHTELGQASAHLGFVDVLLVLIEADETPNPGCIPVEGQSGTAFKNDHLGYAITWFGLAAALLVAHLAYHKSRGCLTLGVAGSARDR
jgi:surfeit locus 1 family protein